MWYLNGRQQTNEQKRTHAYKHKDEHEKKSKQQNMGYYRNHVRNGWAVVIFVETVLHSIPFLTLSLPFSFAFSFAVLMGRDFVFQGSLET